MDVTDVDSPKSKLVKLVVFSREGGKSFEVFPGIVQTVVEKKLLSQLKDTSGLVVETRTKEQSKKLRNNDELNSRKRKAEFEQKDTERLEPASKKRAVVRSAAATRFEGEELRRFRIQAVNFFLQRRKCTDHDLRDAFSEVDPKVFSRVRNQFRKWREVLSNYLLQISVDLCKKNFSTVKDFPSRISIEKLLNDKAVKERVHEVWTHWVHKSSVNSQMKSCAERLLQIVLKTYLKKYFIGKNTIRMFPAVDMSVLTQSELQTMLYKMFECDRFTNRITFDANDIKIESCTVLKY